MAVFKSLDKSDPQDRQMMQIIASYPKYSKLLEHYGKTETKEQVIEAALDSLIENAGELSHAMQKRRRYT